MKMTMYRLYIIIGTNKILLKHKERNGNAVPLLVFKGKILEEGMKEELSRIARYSV